MPSTRPHPTQPNPTQPDRTTHGLARVHIRVHVQRQRQRTGAPRLAAGWERKTQRWFVRGGVWSAGRAGARAGGGSCETMSFVVVFVCSVGGGLRV
jgi:hypothetical protein